MIWSNQDLSWLSHIILYLLTTLHAIDRLWSLHSISCSGFYSKRPHRASPRDLNQHRKRSVRSWREGSNQRLHCQNQARIPHALFGIHYPQCHKSVTLRQAELIAQLKHLSTTSPSCNSFRTTLSQLFFIAQSWHPKVAHAVSQPCQNRLKQINLWYWICSILHRKISQRHQPTTDTMPLACNFIHEAVCVYRQRIQLKPPSNKQTRQHQLLDRPRSLLPNLTLVLRKISTDHSIYVVRRSLLHSF